MELPRPSNHEISRGNEGAIKMETFEFAHCDHKATVRITAENLDDAVDILEELVKEIVEWDY